MPYLPHSALIFHWPVIRTVKFLVGGDSVRKVSLGTHGILSVCPQKLNHRQKTDNNFMYLVLFENFETVSPHLLFINKN